MSAAERRAARKAELAQRYEAQRETDLEALDALEVEYGDSNVAAVHLPADRWVPDLPTLAVARCPKPAEVKRYRDTTAKAHGSGDIRAVTDAAEQIASTCLVYPEKDTYERLREARPGIHVQLGRFAIDLVMGSSEEQGKG